MQAIEFETDLKGSIIKIPSYARLKNKHVKVILMYETSSVSEIVRRKTKTDIFDKFKIDINDTTFDRNEANER